VPIGHVTIAPRWPGRAPAWLNYVALEIGGGQSLAATGYWYVSPDMWIPCVTGTRERGAAGRRGANYGTVE